MESLAGYVATGTVSLVVGCLLIYLQPRAKVFYWMPHTFFFDLKKEQVLLQTDSLTVQNLGRQTAHKVEVVFDKEPDFYQLQPAVSHEGRQLPNGNFAVLLSELGPKEFYTFQILSYKQVPRLLNVRSDSGQATLLPFQLQRLYPKWAQLMASIFLIVGFGTSAYWVIYSAYKLYSCTTGNP